MLENWKEINGFPGYWVSTEGRVWSEKSHKMLQPGKTGPRRNYLMVILQNNGKRYNKRVHRLVLETFDPEGDFSLDVNHINEDTFDNRLENLEWMTRTQNIQYSTGQMIEQQDKDGNVVNTFPSMRAAARYLGVDIATILHHVNDGGLYKNFFWKRIDNPRKI